MRCLPSLIRAVLLTLACGHSVAAQAEEGWTHFPGVPFVQAIAEPQMERAPDRASISVSVATRATEARLAYATLTPKMNTLIAAARETGLPDTALETSGPTATEVFDIVRDANNREIVEKRVRVGIDAAEHLHVRLDGVDTPDGRQRLERVLEALARAGGTIAGIDFSLSNHASLSDELDRTAVREAIAKARGLIEAAGGRPGRILAVNDSGHSMYNYGSEASLTKRVPSGQIKFTILPGLTTIRGRAEVIIEMLTP